MSGTDLIPIGDVERMAVFFSKSNLFGTKTVDQCVALMLLAQAENVHPAIAFRDFDIIQGRPAKKAEAMLRSFLAAGGKVEWHALTDEIADATFSHPQGGTARISWDMARAKKAGLSGKEMYQKYSRPMLRSRTVSEGCRTVYPASTSGMYVPEEVRQMLKEDKRQEKDMGPAEVIPPEPDEDVTTQIPEGPPIKTRTETLQELCTKAGENLIDMLVRAEVKHADELSETDYDSAIRMLNRKIANRVRQQAEMKNIV